MQWTLFFLNKMATLCLGCDTLQLAPIIKECKKEEKPQPKYCESFPQNEILKKNPNSSLSRIRAFCFGCEIGSKLTECAGNLDIKLLRIISLHLYANLVRSKIYPHQALA